MSRRPLDEEFRIGGVAFTRLGFTAYVIGLAVLALDQLSKYWVLHVLDLGRRPPIKVLPFFHLSFVDNPGVSFGLLRADSDAGRWLLVVFALAVVAALVVWARKVTSWLTAVALGLVMGGAIGNNLIDRIRFGAVTDFLDFHPLFPWVFNVADSGISVGVTLLLIEAFARGREPSAT